MLVYNNPEREYSLRDILFSFKEWVSYLRRNWILILFLTLVSSAAGAFYALNRPPLYQAKLTFVLGDNSGGVNAYAGIASQFGVDLGGQGGGTYQGDNILELLKSRSNIQKALFSSYPTENGEEYLISRYIKSHGIPDVIDIIPYKGKRAQDSLINMIYKRILATHLVIEKIDKKLSIVSVAVNSRDEIFSKYFTEKLVMAVSAAYTRTTTKKSAYNVSVLQKQTDSVRRVLNSAVTGAAVSLDANPNLNPAMQVLRTPVQKRGIDVEANKAILTELVKNLELAKINLRNETPLFEIIDRPVFPLDKTYISLAKGILIGALLGLIISISAIVLKRLYKQIVSTHE